MSLSVSRVCQAPRYDVFALHSNGSIEEIHSDDIETGHIGCIVPVTTSNLSGKNISEIFSFSKLCVCVCVCSVSVCV